MIHATVKFDNNIKEFSSRSAVFSDTMMALMAAAIDGQMKKSGEVPFLPKSTKYAQRGALRTSIRSTKLSAGRYKVTVGENSPAGDYAAAQEAGTTRGHPIKNYSTPGTGAHFFQHAINTVKERAPEYARTALQAAGIRSVF